MQSLLTPMILPDIASVGSSDIGNLGRRVVEHADASAIRPLIDALQDAGRIADATRILTVVAQNCAVQLLRASEKTPDPQGNAGDDGPNYYPIQMSAGFGAQPSSMFSGPRQVSLTAVIAEIIWWDLFDFDGSIFTYDLSVQNATAQLKARFDEMQRHQGHLAREFGEAYNSGGTSRDEMRDAVLSDEET